MLNKLEIREESRQSKDKYRTLFETMPQGVVYQAADGTITAANPAAERILGLTHDQILGRTSFDPRWRAIHADGSEFPGETHPSAVALKLGEEVKDVVMGVFHPIEGEHHWIKIHAVPQFRPGEDRAYQVYTTFEDITQLVRAEQALKESEERYRMLVEHSPDVIGIYQGEKLVFVNQAGANLLGVESPDQLIGRPYADFIPAEELALIQERQNKSDREIPAPLHELRFVRPDGHILYLESAALPITYNDRPAGLFISRDVTARKQAEQTIKAFEHRLSTIVNRAPIVLFALDHQGNYTLSEGRGLESLGIAPGEVVGRNALQLYGQLTVKTSDGQTTTYEQLVDRVMAGEVITGITEIYNAFFETHYLPERDAGGEVIGLIGVATEITRRVLAERARKESEARFRSLFNDSPISLWEDDFSGIKAYLEGLRETGVRDLRPYFEAHPEAVFECLSRAKIVDVNRATVKIYQASTKEELLGGLGRILDPDCYLDYMQGILSIAEGRTKFEIETANRTAQGERIDIILSWSVAPGSESSYDQVLVSVFDVTDRKRIQRAEQEQRALAEALRDTSSALNSSLNQEEVLDQILDNIQRVIDFDAAEILMIEEGMARIVRYRGYEKMGIEPDEVRPICFPLGDFPILRKVADCHQALILADTNEWPDWVDRIRFRWVKSFAVAPIRIQDQVIGFLNVASAQPGYFGSEHGPGLQSLANQAAIALGNAQLYRQVVAGRERMRQLTRQVVSAQEEERRRLSRELHDEAGQSLTALKIGLQLVLAELPQELESARQQMGDAVTLTEQTMGKMRLLAQDLRPPALDAIGLIPTLRDMCQNIGQRSGLVVAFTHKDVPDLPDETRVCLYRFLQEALTNALKHAEAQHLWVSIGSNSQEVSLSVGDDGRGFDRRQARLFSDKGRGMGLLGMHERLELVGGKLDVQTSPRHGTCLTARVPIERGYIERRESDDPRGAR